MFEVTPSASRLSFAPSQECLEIDVILEADARTRTADPFITSEVLYQLSYVGEAV